MLSSDSDSFGSVHSGPHSWPSQALRIDSDDDAAPVILPPRPSTVPAPSPVVHQPPACEPPTVPQPVHDGLPVQELPPVPAAIVPPTCSPVSSRAARFLQVLHLSLLLSFLPVGKKGKKRPILAKLGLGLNVLCSILPLVTLRRVLPPCSTRDCTRCAYIFSASSSFSVLLF